VYRGDVGSWSFVEELRRVFAEDYEGDGDADGGRAEEDGGLDDQVEFWRKGVITSLQDTNTCTGEIDCTICLDPLLPPTQKPLLIKSCNHTFHHACLSRWLEEQNTCPICRALLFKKKEKERPKTMWEELDENAYFIPQLGDVRETA
jgi:hypothetical protein